MLLRHYLEQGVTKAALARQLGVSRRTIYQWLATRQPGGYTQVKEYVRRVRPTPEPEPVQRFETPPGHQGQVESLDALVRRAFSAAC